MKLVYATKNQAKLYFMRKILNEIEVEICGLDEIEAEMNITFPDVPEGGSDPLVNAEIKALTYYKLIRRPLFSSDSGLFLKGIPKELQPGVNVRNIGGKRLNDDEMIEHYSRLAYEAGGRIAARYKNGICLVLSENEIYKHMGDDISYAEFLISDTPHKKRVEGFPIDSLSINIENGKYYYDIENRTALERTADNGFINFFRRAFRI